MSRSNDKKTVYDVSDFKYRMTNEALVSNNMRNALVSISFGIALFNFQRIYTQFTSQIWISLSFILCGVVCGFVALYEY